MTARFKDRSIPDGEPGQVLVLSTPSMGNRQKDYIGVKDVEERLGVGTDKAYELLRSWKALLKVEGRDKLDLPAKITVEDYCHVLGLDIRRFL